MKPLNGTKTHPLSEHAIGELRSLDMAPIPTCSINPGVVNRLLRENLAEVVRIISPFKTNKGIRISHLKITEAGRQAVRDADAEART